MQRAKFIFTTFLFLCLILFFSVSVCFAQKKVDLQVTAKQLSETARGGENLSYEFAVSNVSTETATDVWLLHRLDNMTQYVSAVPSQGTCRIDDEGYGNEALRCSFGEIQGGVIAKVIIEVKVNDFGDVSQPESGAPPKADPTLFPPDPPINSEPPVNKEPVLPSYEKGQRVINCNAYVRAEENDDNRENDNARVSIIAQPSRNIPPRIEIISPKHDAVFINPMKKPVEISIVVKAFDLDGKIVNVQFIDQATQSYEYMKPGEKDTFIWSVKNPGYGEKIYVVIATDDGGRTTIKRIDVLVKGDASLEIVKPKDGYFAPNQTIVVDIVARLNEGKVQEIKLFGTKGQYLGHIPVTDLQLVSSKGNTYTYRYVWKVIEGGIYNLDALLTEDSGASTPSNNVRVVVTEFPKIKITSLKNGQEFAQSAQIPIDVDISDADGGIENVILYVDGISKESPYAEGFRWAERQKKGILSLNAKGTHTIYLEVIDNLGAKTKSETVTIYLR